jgi:uncharacterized membrane protein YkvA (DUF1232 family)
MPKPESRKEIRVMNGITKGMMLVLMFIYIVSPIDFCPGPIDDLIVLMAGIAAQKDLLEY